MMVPADQLPLQNEDIAAVKKLAEAVRLSPFFKRRSDTKNSLSLLELFADTYPKKLNDQDVREALGKKGAIGNLVTRFRERLREAFLRDRSLWKSQRIISLSEEQPWSLNLDYISAILPATWIFWFQQSIRLGTQQRLLNAVDRRKQHQKSEAHNHLIIFSEPLFFFSETLKAYIRLLDVNHEGRIDTAANLELVAKAEKTINEKVPDSHPERLGLVPVQHYLPAGDAYAASGVRGWFRLAIAEMGNAAGEAPGYRDASQVADDDYHRNLIILASRESLMLLAEFQEEHQLHAKLTDKGIKLHDEDHDDVVGRDGFKVAHAVATMWAMDDGGNAHTYIASNHTRATSAVVHTLLDEARMKEIVPSILTNGEIPLRFQLVFRVPVSQHDARRGPEAEALQPELLATIKNY